MKFFPLRREDFSRIRDGRLFILVSLCFNGFMSGNTFDGQQSAAPRRRAGSGCGSVPPGAGETVFTPALTPAYSPEEIGNFRPPRRIFAIPAGGAHPKFHV
jgi:hypothetical protein